MKFYRLSKKDKLQNKLQNNELDALDQLEKQLIQKQVQHILQMMH